MSHLGTSRLSVARRLPRGDREKRRSSARPSRRTAACSDVIERTMERLLSGNVINVFWFSSGGKRRTWDRLRMSCPRFDAL
ncbi:hypothetical protein EYF80_062704 [Liparis tanakae]|uniref:Uncharacterized protein n=1 Tax=Liparis tanakae TaxID=230148 RepID=A0A4Z2EFQ4_9TELE|nr:hypothetical protein EYF80_062704 [Liparis tanakae]